MFGRRSCVGKNDVTVYRMALLMAIPAELRHRFSYVRYMRAQHHVFLEWSEPSGRDVTSKPPRKPWDGVRHEEVS